MPSMVRRQGSGDVNVAGTIYAAQVGDVIDAHPRDVERLTTLGFELVEEESSDERTLEEMSLTELRDVARDVELEGRSSMTRAELIEALSTPSGETQE